MKQLHAFQSGARQHEQMTIIAQSLSEEDVANLAAWYSSIQVTVKLPE
jgi:cytochrome c553